MPDWRPADLDFHERGEDGLISRRTASLVETAAAALVGVGYHGVPSQPSLEEQGQVADAPLGRLGRPEDIAGVVSFLVGPAGRWINGQVVCANGGFV